MTTEIVKAYDVISLEDLNIKGMVQNRKLAKYISDASWGEIERQLSYKSEWHGKSLVYVDPFFPSSQLCGCGYRNKAVKHLKIRVWICPECNVLNDRDLNAAQNIHKEGLRILAAQQYVDMVRWGTPEPDAKALNAQGVYVRPDYAGNRR